jgi:sugar lactone lactonase YvrE
MKKYFLLASAFLLFIFLGCKKNVPAVSKSFESNAEVTTLAGDGMGGFTDGIGTGAEFFLPMGIALDTQGNIFIADEGNNCIREIIGVTQVSSFAGNSNKGLLNGIGTLAEFWGPSGIATDLQGNMYVTDSYNQCVRKISPSGLVSIVAGNGIRGYVDGPGSVAEFNQPNGIAVDGQGNIYIGDSQNFRLRKISPGGTVTTLAGNGIPGSTDGLGSIAQFSYMPSLAADGQGNLYLPDQVSNKIRKITPAGEVSTIAGNGTPGYADGQGPVAEFNQPADVIVDSVGNLYVADQGNNCIRKVNSAGLVSTLAGNLTKANVDGPSGTAEFSEPCAEVMDNYGNLYVGQFGDNRIREITSAGSVVTIAGNGMPGFVNGPALEAEFQGIFGLTADFRGNLFVADFVNNQIRKIQLGGTVGTFAGNGVPGFVDGAGEFAQFYQPTGVATDLQGNIYVTDAGNNCIRKITPDAKVSTLAGSGIAGFADGKGNIAEFNLPYGIAADLQGNLFVADDINNRIRKIDPTGSVTTIAGTGAPGFIDGPGSSAQFNVPDAVAVDAGGNLFVADVANNCIRRISASGIVSTVAGDGRPGFIDGLGKGAEFKQPNGVAVDGKGNIYVADNANNSIRMISPSGQVRTVAGSFMAGFADGSGATAMFNHPFGIAIDMSGQLYIGDLGNNSVRKISFP